MVTTLYRLLQLRSFLIHAPKPTEVVQLLIDNGANVNVQANQGNTLLHYAVVPYPYLDTYTYYGLTDSRIIEILIENNIEMNMTNGEGKTALDLAKKRNQRKEIINRLVEAGAVTTSR